MKHDNCRGFTLVELLVVIAIIGILVAMLLPFHEQDTVHAKYDFTIRNLNTANQDATRAQIPIYQCPSDNSQGRMAIHSINNLGWGRSNVVVCFGSDTMLKDQHGGVVGVDQRGIDYETDGAFQCDDSRRLTKFVDGTSKTVVASEVLAGQDEVYSADDRIWDTRGLWAWCIMGSFAYTHRNTPNTNVGDAIWANPGQDIECVPGPEQAPPRLPLRVAMNCRLQHLLLAVCCLTLLTACGDSRRGSIEGTVTLDGRPLEKGYICFRPQLGTLGPTAGAEILDGRLSILAEGGTFGGTFRVEITASRKTGQKVVDHLSGRLIDAYGQFD